jgi:isoleucyl-tRNA synthetase
MTQGEEFKRLGVIGDFKNPYTTMSLPRRGAHRRRADEVRHVGPALSRLEAVMWSVVERTALAEAEIEYQDYESDTIWVKFPEANAALRRSQTRIGRHLDDHALDDPRQPRHQLFSARVAYGLYEVGAAQNDFGPRRAKLIFADKLAADPSAKGKAELESDRGFPLKNLARSNCRTRSRASAAATISSCPARWRSRHRRRRHRLRAHRAGPRPRGL